MWDKTSYIRNKILERNIESCKDITPDQMETISLLSMEHDEYERIKNEKHEKKTKTEPLLIIELENETSVPKVIYKGEEILYKKNISLDWETDTDEMGGLSYSIEHALRDEGYPVTNRIERRVKGHSLY